ncbi:hypothetical protein AYP76_03215 [Ligilactobacillus agilis]|uniref:Polysaccharide biosynthesis protein n=1 Tax=Ligilactobacillus agilis TaxID=1601 RepID=A0A226RC71_9LACO|nr:hypothetical protein AYP75_10405 [Ligilactobacillus agilis]OXC09928.1 hypothetical protein AYP74_00615 [Ligilactobacillus agilis]OXC10215.1 hypothetical protein AYP76_03215 [Ligilactobacillus agilis]OXS38564.1 hypothetical protein AYP70_07385 [Ligilactobacillus agilis]OXS40715.1 hypothetical protein AYP69_04420 [Ligilactobacillus agilis]
MKLIRNYLYNAGYQMLALIIPFITAPYISRTLKPHGVGIYADTNAWIQWFVLNAFRISVIMLLSLLNFFS